MKSFKQSFKTGRKEGNVLFNDAHNSFKTDAARKNPDKHKENARSIQNVQNRTPKCNIYNLNLHFRMIIPHILVSQNTMSQLIYVPLFFVSYIYLTNVERTKLLVCLVIVLNQSDYQYPFGKARASPFVTSVESTILFSATDNVSTFLVLSTKNCLWFPLEHKGDLYTKLYLQILETSNNNNNNNNNYYYYYYYNIN